MYFYKITKNNKLKVLSLSFFPSRRNKNVSYVASRANLSLIKCKALASSLSHYREAHPRLALKSSRRSRERGAAEGTKCEGRAGMGAVVRGNRPKGRPAGIPHTSRIFLRSQRVPVIP